MFPADGTKMGSDISGNRGSSTNTSLTEILQSKNTLRIKTIFVTLNWLWDYEAIFIIHIDSGEVVSILKNIKAHHFNIK
jgi:hypothetical protein